MYQRNNKQNPIIDTILLANLLKMFKELRGQEEFDELKSIIKTDKQQALIILENFISNNNKLIGEKLVNTILKD